VTRKQLADSIKRCVVVYQANYKQTTPCHSREYYRSKRHHIRSLRRHWPTHMDVLYWQNSLGLEEWETFVTKRTTYDWEAQSWIELPRHVLPGYMQTGLNIGMAGPVGRLPGGNEK